MNKIIITLALIGIFAVATPAQAQYGGGSSVSLPGSFQRSRGGSARVPTPITNFVNRVQGEVLGAATNIEAERQAKIEGVKSQLMGLIYQLIAMLQSQIASAQAAL